MKIMTQHIKHYTPLIGILCAGLFGFWLFSFDRTFQVALVIATALGYVTWGVMYHKAHENLDSTVFLEYVIIATLGVILILTLVLRA